MAAVAAAVILHIDVVQAFTTALGTPSIPGHEIIFREGSFLVLGHRLIFL